MPSRRVLLVEDEPGVRFGVSSFLTDQGFEINEAVSAAEALDCFSTLRPDIVVIDYRLPDDDGLALAGALREQDPAVPFVFLTGHGSVEMAVAAMKVGAETVLTKPVDLGALLGVLHGLLELGRSRRRNLAGQRARHDTRFDLFAGSSPAITKLAELAERVAGSERPVLLYGETGTGKSVLARWLHEASPRAEQAFVELNCAGFSRDLLESELFGHERGAFTGALQRKLGLLEVAHRGTVFLDEVGDVDLTVQPRLLKVLEEHRFRRIGETRERHVDLRLISATHQDLSQLVAQRSFREDLYFRLATLPLMVPPLRERRSDLPGLAATILQSLSRDFGRSPVELEPSAIAWIEQQAWPGNFRQLRNTLERALLFSDRRSLSAQDLMGTGLLEPPASRPPSLRLLDAEREHILRVVEAAGSNLSAAAEMLGISRSTLYAKLRSSGDLERLRGRAPGG
jgi:DNA-binding NtrC family response regulator